MYSVGDQTFSTIQEARAYDFETSGTINNVRAITSFDDDPFGDDPFGIPEFEDLPGGDSFRNLADSLFRQFIEQTEAEDRLQRWIRRNVLNDTRDPEDQDGEPSDLDTLFADDTFQMIWDSIVGRIGDVPPEISGDETATQEWYNSQIEAALEEIEQTGGVSGALERAQDIVDTMYDNPEALANMEDPGELTKLFIEQGGMSFAGVVPPVATTTTVTGREVVVTEGGGIAGNIFDILETGGQIFGENVPVVQYDVDGNPLRDENGDLVTVEEYRPGILDVMIPHLPGISLPNWMPSAGVIFLPTIQEAVNKVWTIIDETDIGEAWEEGDIGELLNDIGEIIVRSGEAAAGVIEEKVGEIIGTITGAISDPTRAGSVIGGVVGVAFPSIPQWLPPLILDPRVYGAVRSVLTQNFNTPEEDFPPFNEEVEEDEVALMFTNRGNNYFVNKESDEFLQLAESEEYEFDFNEEYTREQLEDTGLETINSGTYQSLLDDLSFHALEEDIYQYSMDDLIARYEEEGGVLPGDWKTLDEESRYNFFLADYFDLPTYIRDPDRGGDRDDEDEGDGTGDGDGDADQDPVSVVEGLFADFLEQLDTEFTGQQEQINTIINNFVETLPDFDAMPTMEDIAEYFELNGVTLSEQNFERIRQELADAGYLTEEQLTEALAGVATTEQVQEAIQGAGFATPEQVIQALAEAGYATPADIADAFANSGFVTEERLTLALSEAGYLTAEEFRLTTEELRQAISELPDGATEEEVRQIIQEAIDSLPGSGEGLSVDDVREIINEAISGIDLPDAVTAEQVRSILDSFGFSTSEEVQAGFENIQENFEDLTSRFNDAINGIATEFSEQEALFLESITGLEASLIQSLSNIEGGLSAELEMLDTNIITLQEAVEAGFNDFAAFATEEFGLASEERQRLQEAIIAVDGNVTQLSADFQREFEEFGGTLAELFEGVGFSIEDLQQGQISQAEAFESLNSYLAEQFETAGQERQNLQEAILNVGGDVNLLSDTMFDQFQAQNETIEELFAGTNVNIEALALGQISQTEAINQFQDYVSDEFLAAQEDRIRITEALISVNGNLENLNLASLDTFNDLNLSIEELANEFNVNFEALQQGQISQFEAYNEFQDNVTQRLDISNEQLEDILAGQDDILSGQQDILAGQEDIIMGQEEFQILYGEQQQALEDQIMAGNVLNALAAGGMFAPAAAPARVPYEDFLQGITYRPREAPELAIKTPAVDYNEEAQQLLMRTRRRGMLA
jgi:hypothetical protein